MLAVDTKKGRKYQQSHLSFLLTFPWMPKGVQSKHFMFQVHGKTVPCRLSTTNKCLKKLKKMQIHMFKSFNIYPMKMEQSSIWGDGRVTHSLTFVSAKTHTHTRHFSGCFDFINTTFHTNYFSVQLVAYTGPSGNRPTSSAHSLPLHLFS